jgi:hypothetical protein
VAEAAPTARSVVGVSTGASPSEKTTDPATSTGGPPLASTWVAIAGGNGRVDRKLERPR